VKKLIIFLSIACLSFTANAESVLIENVRIFNGVDARLSAGHVPSSQFDAFTTLHNVYAVKVSKHYLDSGFTSIRDAGGTHPHFARAIDAGDIPDPFAATVTCENSCGCAGGR